jgi:dTDP-4-amino-4,6-dideoxygalactose transaminase
MNVFNIPSKGQKNVPKISELKRNFKKIFKNKYYTNHGPFVQELEKELQQFLNVKHVMAMTNESIALIIAAKALDLKGKVLCSEFISASALNSLIWAGLEPLVCKANATTLSLDSSSFEKDLDSDVCAILGSHVQPNLSEIIWLEDFAKSNNLKLYFDSSSSFGSFYKNKRLGCFGDLEVFSFHENEIINSAEGGIISTNDDELAKKVRNIRSSYGSGPIVKVPITGNGRMSEAQAVLALLSLSDYEKNYLRNKKQFRLYEKLLKECKYINIVKHENVVKPNFSSVTVRLKNHKNLDFKNLQLKKFIGKGIFSNLSIDTNFDSNELIIELPTGNLINNKVINEICDTLISSISGL